MQHRGALGLTRANSDELSAVSLGNSNSNNSNKTGGGGGRQRKTRRRDNGSSSASNTGTHTAESSANWLFTFLVAGLVFCLIDACFIMRFIMVRKEKDDTTNNTSTAAQLQRNTGTTYANIYGGGANGETISTEPIITAATNTMMVDHRHTLPPTRPLSVNTTTTPSTAAESTTLQTHQDKQHILNLLKEAGVHIDNAMRAKLPTWHEVSALYGAEPVIFGLDTCKQFQESGDAGDHFVASAGTFNTGTNLMAELLISNCHMPGRMKKWGAKNRGVRWQVLWGKHTPVGDESFRQGHRTYNDSTLTANNIFPAVTVRDPFKWMQSMCRHEYGAQWKHSEEHCPNLVPNVVDIAQGWANETDEAIPVQVKYKEFTNHHESLVDFWNSWYQDYIKADWPRLLVRFEDLVFHPRKVTQTVCECAGGEMNKVPFKYIVDSAKKGAGAHGKERTSYVDALVKYGTEKGRYKGMDPADLAFARQHLDPELMKLFGYPYPQQDVI